MKHAQLARDNQRCRETVGERVISMMGLRGGIAPVVTRGGLVDVAQIKAASPLPETTDELCAVARHLNADVREMRLGQRATEREIKALSASGRLAQYRILHFATHGALAGQLTGTAEPGLILTPPATASEEDDGYLSAGEIASLKLDADWVILSACNTAAGGAAGAEALGGLARAFFYAQARALLVSHWEVDSEATVKLITATITAITKDSTVGRAEALLTPRWPEPLAASVALTALVGRGALVRRQRQPGVQLVTPLSCDGAPALSTPGLVPVTITLGHYDEVGGLSARFSARLSLETERRLSIFTKGRRQLSARNLTIGLSNVFASLALHRRIKYRGFGDQMLVNLDGCKPPI